MIRIGIVGATGYAGEELTRLLFSHPDAKITHLVSRSFAGKRLSEVYANYAPFNELLLEDLQIDTLAKDTDVVFTALPHGQSLQIVPQLIDAGVKVIDLSGDFRYDDAQTYETWYGIHHDQPSLLAEAVYGLPELYAEKIKKSRIVANPGCYTTASILALYPLLKEGLIQKDGIVIDAKSGITGAGRKEALPYAFCEADESFKAYGVTTHRHTSEIEQELSHAADSPVALCFTPHLLPVKRGILATCYTNLTPGTTAAAIAQAYEKMYKNKPFTTVLPHTVLPELKMVNGSNHCMIGYRIDPRLNRLIVVSCIDNLIKGAAGQAVHNMNLMFDLPETEGLPLVAWYL